MIVSVVHGFIFGEHDSLFLSLALIGILCVTTLTLFILSGNIRCPLCHVKIMRRNGASMNSRHKKTLLGSPRLFIASRVAFSDHYRCPYCGEPCNTSRSRR